MATTITNPGPMPDASDFKAYDAWRDAGGNLNDPAGDDASDSAEESEEVAPATSEEDQPLSDAEAELAAASAEGEGESEEATDETAEASEATEQEPQQGKKQGIEKRFRKLNNRIAERERENQDLRERLARLEGHQEAQEGDETEESEEAEEVPPAAAKTARPKLSDYDTMEDWLEADSVWLEQTLEAQKAEAKAEKDRELAQAAAQAHQAEWNRQTARFTDYNEVVTDDVKISHAMTAVMKGTMSPEDGTRVAYYLGKHPDEALKIAEQTLAPTRGHWVPAQQRAAIALGKILAKLDADPSAGVPQKKTPTLAAKTATPKPAAGTPLASKAKRPPAPLKGAAVRPGPQSSMDVDPTDFKKWEAAREREIAAKNGRR